MCLIIILVEVIRAADDPEFNVMTTRWHLMLVLHVSKPNIAHVPFFHALLAETQ